MEQYNLDTPLIKLSNEQSQQSYWTARNAVEGVQIFGGIGSGKTSGSGRLVALKFLEHGFGGLVLTVKPDETTLWKEYCAAAGRTDDLLIVSPKEKNYFNFLEYESRDGEGQTENIVQVLKTVIHASAERSGVSDDAFWDTALDMLLFSTIDLCKLAYGKVSVQRMYDIVMSLPKDGVERISGNAFDTAYEIARKKVTQQTDDWEQTLSADELAQLDTQSNYEAAQIEALADARTLKYINEFFEKTFLTLSDKTRSIIEFSFSGFLFRLLRDPIYSLFCRHASTFTPEVCLTGKIILLDLPVKMHDKIGRDSQILFKYIWQRAMERRMDAASGRPVFLWADEAQNFLHEHDTEYQATARSSRIATVYISQNLPNYHANMGGAKSDQRVKSFLGTLATKIFHANADIETNEYASKLIGDGYFQETSESVTAAGQFSASTTKAVKVDRIVRPEEFVSLRTGGDLNGHEVEGYIHVQGNPLQNGQNFSQISFNQKYTPKP